MIKYGLIGLLLLGLAGCNHDKVQINPKIESLRLPPLPISLKSDKCQAMVTIPDRKLNGKELIALLAKVRASEAYKAGCNHDFEKWYSTVRKSYRSK